MIWKSKIRCLRGILAVKKRPQLRTKIKAMLILLFEQNCKKECYCAFWKLLGLSIVWNIKDNTNSYNFFLFWMYLEYHRIVFSCFVWIVSRCIYPNYHYFVSFEVQFHRHTSFVNLFASFGFIFPFWWTTLELSCLLSALLINL